MSELLERLRAEAISWPLASLSGPRKLLNDVISHIKALEAERSVARDLLRRVMAHEDSHELAADIRSALKEEVSGSQPDEVGKSGGGPTEIGENGRTEIKL